MQPFSAVNSCTMDRTYHKSKGHSTDTKWPYVIGYHSLLKQNPTCSVTGSSQDKLFPSSLSVWCIEENTYFERFKRLLITLATNC